MVGVAAVLLPVHTLELIHGDGADGLHALADADLIHHQHVLSGEHVVEDAEDAGPLVPARLQREGGGSCEGSQPRHRPWIVVAIRILLRVEKRHDRRGQTEPRGDVLLCERLVGLGALEPLGHVHVLASGDDVFLVVIDGRDELHDVAEDLTRLVVGGQRAQSCEQSGRHFCEGINACMSAYWENYSLIGFVSTVSESAIRTSSISSMHSSSSAAKPLVWRHLPTRLVMDSNARTRAKPSALVGFSSFSNADSRRQPIQLVDACMSYLRV